SHWTLTHGDAVSQVESGTCAFYIERPGGQRAEVIVAMDVHAHKYLKTVADRDQPDQLLFLPACLHVAHSPNSVPSQRVVGAYAVETRWKLRPRRIIFLFPVITPCGSSSL